MRKQEDDVLSELANLNLTELLADLAESIDLQQWLTEIAPVDLNSIFAEVDLSDLIGPSVQSSPEVSWETIASPDSRQPAQPQQLPTRDDHQRYLFLSLKPQIRI